MLVYTVSYLMVAAVVFACCRLLLGEYTDRGDVIVDTVISVLWPITVPASLLIWAVSALCARAKPSDDSGVCDD